MDYYVSKMGSDGNDGRTAETAWRTLGKVNTTDLAPGDVVRFQRGGLWRGQLKPRCGDDTAPITYAAYGSGDKPRLLGSVVKNRVDDWVSEGGNIWRTKEPETIAAELLRPLGSSEAISGWRIYAEHGASARLEQVASDTSISFRVECLKPGDGGSDIQCYAVPFSIEQGKAYRLAFRAKCTASAKLAVPVLMRSGAPWNAYGSTGFREAVPLSGEWATFTFYYTAFIAADDARLTFFLGDALPANASLDIGDISLRECRGDEFLCNDVGNIIFDGEASCGVKVWKTCDLDAQDEYWYDEARHVLKLYSADCPATRHSDIECAIREHIIDQTGCHHIVYENLALYYGGAHGIGGGSTHHITVRDCDFGFIGGGDQMGGDRTVRFGNGIEFWGTAHDHLVERCRLWEIYDAALTNQSGGPRTPQYNIVYRGNVIWNSEYSFEYWNRPEDSETYNIRFEHNTCFNAGSGWGHAQRPDPSGRHLCFYTSPARAREIYVLDNIFCGALANAFYAPKWPRPALDALVMDHNCWFQPEGDMILFEENRYPMGAFTAYQRDYGKEPHSLAADPRFVDAKRWDFHLQADSPCVDAGNGPNTATDMEGTPVRGAASDIGAYENLADSAK